MTVPATTNTAYSIIQNALVNAGYLAEGDEPSGEQLALYMRRLNNLINGLQTEGLKLWLNYDLAITLIAGQNLYTLGPAGNVVMTKPLRVLEGYYLDTNNVRRPLIPMSRNDWDTLSVTTSQGTVNSYFIDKQQSTLNVYFWLTPDANAATGKAHIIIQQQVTNFVSVTDAMNFPPEWANVLEWGLADEISTGQPEAIVAKCAMKFAFWKDKLEAWDVEDPGTMFTPDPRSFQWGRMR